MNALIKAAAQLAFTFHKGQKDKSGEPYIDHVSRVAARAGEWGGQEAEIVGWLHDLVEDTPATLADLRLTFPDNIVQAVDAVTHRKDEQYFDFVKRSHGNELGRIVKLADVIDNLRPGIPKEHLSLHERYFKALRILLSPF